jgi:type III secretion protein S
MDLTTLTGFSTQGMILCLDVAMPIVIVAALVGLCVSFLQAVTSMQDQTLSQGVKLVAVVIAIAIAAPISGAAVLRFANQVLAAAAPQ